MMVIRYSILLANEFEIIRTPKLRVWNMEYPANISGPVSAHVIDLPECRIFVFGDEHFAYDNLCEPCRARDGCNDVVRFVRRAASRVRRMNRARTGSAALDVFVELPYVVRDGPKRRRWLRLLDQIMSKDPEGVFPRRRSSSSPDSPSASGKRGPGGGFRWHLPRLAASAGGGGGGGNEEEEDANQAMVARVLDDASPRYIGVISQLYREFRDDFYAADAMPPPDAIIGDQARARFHYCDARQEVHVARLLPIIDPARFHRYVRTSDQLRDVMRAFLFAPDFEREVKRIFGTREAARLLTRRTSRGAGGANAGMGAHKVAKQFLALPEGRVRDAARRYLEDRLEDAVSVARLDLGFDRGPHILAASHSAQAKKVDADDHFEWLGKFRRLHGQYYEAFFPEVIKFSTHLLLMDAYLLCRLLRFCCCAPPTRAVVDRTAIVYAGDTHAEFYVAFFVDYLGVDPAVCAKLGDRRGRDAAATNRCVDMRPAGRRCATLGAHPAAVRPISSRTRTISVRDGDARQAATRNGVV